MQLDPVSPSRQERYFLVCDAMRAVDAIDHRSRGTTDMDQRVAWMMEVWQNSQIATWLWDDASHDWPALRFGTRASGLFDVDATDVPHAPRVMVRYGPRVTDDLTLALSFATAARTTGMFKKASPTRGSAYDSITVTLTTMALHVHSPARAKEFWDLAWVIGLPGRPAPHGVWKPKKWAS
jgi:hypothetical protein